MKKILQRFIFVLCLTPLSINDIQAYIVPAAPDGFKHFGNNAARIGSSATIDELDSDEIANLINGHPVTYFVDMYPTDRRIPHEAKHIPYNITLNEHNAGNMDLLSSYFAQGNNTAAWLQYVSAVKADDNTTVTYNLMTLTGDKPSFTRIVYLIDIKRATPTYGRATAKKHETHLAFAELAHQFPYQGTWYKLSEANIAIVNAQAEAHDAADGEPKVILKTFFNKDRGEGVMEGDLWINNTIVQTLDFKEVGAP